ncbi:Transposable element Tc3 transposase, partial [Caligus rogercresseyi]
MVVIIDLVNRQFTKLRTKFTLLDIKPSTRMRTVRTEENFAAVASSVNENREMSIRRRSQQLGLCYSTTWKILTEMNLVNMWFHQDGATCHTARETMNMLKDEFGEQLISRNGPVSWPPRSCDLTPLDYFLWGYVKSLVYVDKPNTIEALQDNITRVIRRIQPEMLEQ